jgi:superfamily I DNA/RNA helicase
MELNIIYGPPGTGKTTHLLNILEKELETVEPNKIAFVSFTRQGSYEGRDRAIDKFKFHKSDLPFFRTLHSLAFQNLGLKKEDVISKFNYRQFSEAMNMKFTGYYTEDFNHTDDRYLFFDMLHRNNPKTASKYLDGLESRTLHYVRANYKKFRQDLNLLDYTDMLEMFVEQNEPLPVEVAIIDEAQDLTTLQWKMIWTAFGHCKRVYVAGDDDQGIYEWSGADLTHLLNLKGEQKVLDKSYRLPENILNYSKNITALINKRVDKRYKSVNEGGEVNFINDLNNLQIDSEQTWLFLSRNNCFLKEVETYLRQHGFLYSKKGKVSFNMAVYNAIVAYEKVRKKKAGEETYYKFHNYIDEMHECGFTRPWFDIFNIDPNEIEYYRDVIGHNSDIKAAPKIRVETIHSSKGSEADNVVLLMDMTRNVYKNYSNNADSELRCYYVGATRAKRRLFLVDAKGKHSFPAFI